MSHNIEVQGGTSVRLPTAGKYCDRDIVITATGGGGGQVGGLSQYAKFIAKPTEMVSFVIANPLGGIAKKVSVQKTTAVTSSRRCQKYLADFDLGIGVGEYADTSSRVLYAVSKTEGTVGNGNFNMTEGTITLYRFNAANAWDVTAEYEVEIWQ